MIINRSRRFVFPLIIIFLILVTLLCGCYQPSTKFDPKKAIFFNPVTNEINRIYEKNLNRTGLDIHHLDQVELIVGLKDLEGNLGENYTLSLNVVYIEFGGSSKTTINLSQILDINLITNKSGIARTSFTYNQYIWPKSPYTTGGHFNISCSKLNNNTAISDTFNFRYYHSELTRNSSTQIGLTAIHTIEMMNLLEEALNLGGINNSYEEIVFTRPDLLYLIINKSLIDYFGSLLSAPRIEFIYKAWATEVEDVNLSYSNLNTIWEDHINYELPESLISENWHFTGLISQLNLTEGWLVLQYLSYYSFADPLNIYSWGIYQLAILSTDSQLLWLTSFLYHFYT